MAEFIYELIFTPGDSGGFVVTCPVLPGLMAEGKTKGEAEKNAIDAIRTYLENYEPDDDEEVPSEFSVVDRTDFYKLLEEPDIQEKINRITKGNPDDENLDIRFNEEILNCTAKEQIEILEQDGYLTLDDWSSSEARQRAIDNNSLWVVSYDKNTVAFDQTYSDNLADALDKMIEILEA